jgi:hypothetical protein
MISGFLYLTQQQENKWIFYAAGNSWQIWEKPDGCNMIHIVVIGAGSGGGDGVTRGFDTGFHGGGGGGAAGGISTIMIPAYTIPDKLHIQVGAGGAGGAASTAGSPGGATYIGLIPDTTNTTANILISNTQAAGAGGGRGVDSNSAGGAGGSAASVTWATPFTGWGKYVNVINAQSGQSGNPPTVDFVQTAIVGGGAGGAWAGGNLAAAGRSVTSQYKQPSAVVYSVGQPIGSSGKSGNGPNLISPQSQFFGGAGGATLLVSASVFGGDGGIGCGGGGGGGGAFGNTNTTGGRGGNGLVIITCW